VQEQHRQLVVLLGEFLEVRPPQPRLKLLDVPLQLGDPLTVVRQLQPEHDPGVAGVQGPCGPVPEVVPDAPQRSRADAGQLQLALGEVAENPIRRAPQQREPLQVG
jgi:hypothetical protein